MITIDLIEFEPSLANRQKLSLNFQNVEAVKFQEVRATDVVQVRSERQRKKLEAGKVRGTEEQFRG